MSQHARMVKALGGLVVAMTTLSAFLGWIDPSQSAPEPAPSFEAMLARARDIVTNDIAVPSNYWRGVTLVTGRPSTPHRLSATVNRQPAHFVVDGNGRLSRTAYWDRQEEIAGAPHEVTVAVTRSADGRPMTQTQQYAVRALVAAVADAASPNGEAIPVHLHEDGTDLYAVTPGEEPWFDAIRTTE